MVAPEPDTALPIRNSLLGHMPSSSHSTEEHDSVESGAEATERELRSHTSFKLFSGILLTTLQNR